MSFPMRIDYTLSPFPSRPLVEGSNVENAARPAVAGHRPRIDPARKAKVVAAGRYRQVSITAVHVQGAPISHSMRHNSDAAAQARGESPVHQERPLPIASSSRRFRGTLETHVESAPRQSDRRARNTGPEGRLRRGQPAEVGGPETRRRHCSKRGGSSAALIYWNRSGA